MDRYLTILIFFILPLIRQMSVPSNCFVSIVPLPCCDCGSEEDACCCCSPVLIIAYGYGVYESDMKSKYIALHSKYLSTCHLQTMKDYLNKKHLTASVTMITSSSYEEEAGIDIAFINKKWNMMAHDNECSRLFDRYKDIYGHAN